MIKEAKNQSMLRERMRRKYPDALKTKIELGEEEMSVGLAIDWIDRRMCMGRLKENCFGTPRFEYFKDEPHIAGEMAIKALEKQIPKKPILTDHDHDEHFSKTVECANCNKVIGAWLYGRSWCEGSKKYFIKSHKYCNECGIKLDWSEEQ